MKLAGKFFFLFFLMIITLAAYGCASKIEGPGTAPEIITLEGPGPVYLSQESIDFAGNISVPMAVTYRDLDADVRYLYLETASTGKTVQYGPLRNENGDYFSSVAARIVFHANIPALPTGNREFRVLLRDDRGNQVVSEYGHFDIY